MFKVGDKVKVVKNNISLEDGGEKYDMYIGEVGIIHTDFGVDSGFRYYIYFNNNELVPEAFDSDELQLLEDKPCIVTSQSTERN